jgi:hypothetical protein
VSTLADRPLTKGAYLDALDKMILHDAETSKDPRAVKELKDDARARAADKLYQSPAAFSIISGKRCLAARVSLETG